MFKKIFNHYCSVPLFMKMAVAFVLGIIGGIVLFKIGESSSSACAEKIIQIIAPFGTVLISMLKMIVIPIILVLQLAVLIGVSAVIALGII